MNWLTQAWYKPTSRWVWILAPFTALFWLISYLRRWSYSLGWLHASKPNVPVIIVGNLSVGGNGKTPTVLALAHYLVVNGFKPGILSRGYGGEETVFPHLVAFSDKAKRVGDEPALMAKRQYCPVVIDPKRSRGAHYLSEQCGCNLVICDDGLQHYALQRDIEIVVMDDRRLGNGFLLPMGPLREGKWRLGNIDFLIINDTKKYTSWADNNYSSAVSSAFKEWPITLQTNKLRKVNNPLQEIDICDIKEPVCAVAAIGNPQRFFDTLQSLSVNIKQRISFIDHHQFTVSDLPNTTVIMTEKDAVKCSDFAHEDCWYLPVEGMLDDAFYEQLLYKLKGVTHGL